jgi:hypothetical protein
MMLGQHFKVSLRNGAGSSGTYTVLARFFKWDGNALVYDDTERALMNAQAIGAGAWGSGAAFDNSTTKWIGADLTISSSTSLAHALTVQRQVSTDGGSTYPEDGLGVGVGTQHKASAGTLSGNLRML